MRRLLAVALFGTGVGMFVGCSSSSSSGTVTDPISACKEQIGITCDKIFNCFSKDELDAAKSVVGLNAADCKDKLGVDCTDDKTKCSSGETFHADKAQSCTDGYRTLNCTDIKTDPIPEPAACSQVCTK